MEGPTYKGREVKGREGKGRGRVPRLLRFLPGSRGARIVTALSFSLSLSIFGYGCLNGYSSSSLCSSSAACTALLLHIWRMSYVV